MTGGTFTITLAFAQPLIASVSAPNSTAETALWAWLAVDGIDQLCSYTAGLARYLAEQQHEDRAA